MKRPLSPWLPILLLGLTAGGCSMLSLNIFFGDDALVHDPALEGVWLDGRDTLTIQAVSKNMWNKRQLTLKEGESPVREGDKIGVYHVVYQHEDEAAAGFVGLVSQFGTHCFMEIWPFGPEPGMSSVLRRHMLPMCTVWRIELAGDKLEARGLDVQMLVTTKDEKQIHLDMQRIEQGRLGSLFSQLETYLTAPSEDLTRFLLNHGGDDDLFSKREGNSYQFKRARRKE